MPQRPHVFIIWAKYNFKGRKERNGKPNARINAGNVCCNFTYDVSG